jgi:signal transduction histidine kinase
VHLAAEAKAIRLETILDPLAGPISGDPARLQQIVWNLLSNAIKFTPKKGRVQIRLERINSHIEIIVSDTGTGISPEFCLMCLTAFVRLTAQARERTAD